jgi:glutamyl-tRNA reductase
VSVVVVGANHRTAPLDLLERMAVTGDRLPKLLHDLDAGEHTSEVVVLATCNRTEVYLVAERFHGAYR